MGEAHILCDFLALLTSIHDLFVALSQPELRDFVHFDEIGLNFLASTVLEPGSRKKVILISKKLTFMLVIHYPMLLNCKEL